MRVSPIAVSEQFLPLASLERPYHPFHLNEAQQLAEFPEHSLDLAIGLESDFLLNLPLFGSFTFRGFFLPHYILIVKDRDKMSIDRFGLDFRDVNHTWILVAADVYGLRGDSDRRLSA